MRRWTTRRRRWVGGWVGGLGVEGRDIDGYPFVRLVVLLFPNR